MALIQTIIRKRKQAGYTVIEVMIVLSVSAILFATALAGYSYQNKKTEFTNAVRDMEVTIQDILNDVSTGYYPNSNNFSCSRSGSPAVPSLDPTGSSEQGTNQDCIFLGKAVDVDDDFLRTYTIVGLRDSAADEDTPPTNVEEAESRTIPYDGTFDQHTLHASIDITQVITQSGADSAGFAVVSGFGNGDDGGAGATTTQVSTASINPSYNFASATSRTINNSNLNQDITICIQETGGGRQASIKIGAGAQTNIETMIDGWAPECN